MMFWINDFTMVIELFFDELGMQSFCFSQTGMAFQNEFIPKGAYER